jgi:glycosyltransferase involved in cell wall biosynthesis
MHVAIVCRGLGAMGSVALVALHQARELARHGTVTIISESLPPIDTPGTARELAPVRDVGFLRRFRHVVDEILFTRAARRALFAVHRRQPVDFVLAHSHAVIHLAARPFCHDTGAKCGFFVHGDIFDRPTGMYDPRLTAFYRWAAPRGYRSADVVFALAKPFAEIARRNGARRVEIIPNGIDPTDIGLDAGSGEETPRAERNGDEPLRILSVGRLSIEKGFVHLLDACTHLDVDYSLEILGGGPLESTLREAIASRGLGSHVRLLGTLPRNELGAVYRRHHVLCTPTLSEPFALVIMEALASGLPVIGTNVGGIPEVVEDGRNGLLVPPADPVAMAAAIARIARDEPFRRQLAEHGRESVLPRLNWPSIGDRLASVIRMLV